MIKDKPEREFEIGKDETWFANVKATFDELLKHLVAMSHEGLESTKRNRTVIDKILSDAQQHDNTKQTVAEQALQNAVETANMVGKQAVRHGDIAIDRQWNLDAETMQAVVAKVVAEMAAEKKK